MQRTVLFVSPGPGITTPASGEGTRLKHLSQALSVDWDVVVMVPETAHERRPEWVTEIYTYNQWSLPSLTDLNPAFIRVLQRILNEHQIDVVHLSKGVCTASVLTSKLQLDTKIVYAAQNVEAEHATDFVDPSLPIHKRLLGPRLIPFIEYLTVQCADRITTVSEADRRTFIERYDVSADRIAAIPTGVTEVDKARLRSKAEVREEFGIEAEYVAVFHGSYTHPPNREAVELIDKDIAPRLSDRSLNLDWLLVGKGMPACESRNVHSVGFVEDLFSVLNVADVAVVPICHGGGTKTKVYDYISLSLPIVSTTKGVEGIDLEDRTHAAILPDVDETFVETIIDVVRDDDKRDRMSKHLQKLGDRWSWDRSAERLNTLYQN